MCASFAAPLCSSDGAGELRWTTCFSKSPRALCPCPGPRRPALHGSTKTKSQRLRVYHIVDCSIIIYYIVYYNIYMHRVLDRAPKEAHSLTPRARIAHRRHRLTRAIAELAPARAKKTLGRQGSCVDCSLLRKGAFPGGPQVPVGTP